MKLFFDHIPKTAGSSLHVFLSEAFEAKKVTPKLKGHKLASVLSLYKDYQVIIGHFGFIPGESLPSEYISATVLRNPLERTLSDYYFKIFDVPENQLSLLERKLKVIPIEQAFWNEEICAYFTNFQAVHFASFFHVTPKKLPKDELLLLAKRGLDQYALVGITERLSEFCDELKRIFNLPKNVTLKRVNVTSFRRKFSELPSNLQRRIEEINQVDMELWRYAEQLFDTKTKQFQSVNSKIAITAHSTCQSECEMPVQPVSFEDESLELLDVCVKSGMRSLAERLLGGEDAILSIAFRCHQDIDDLTIGYSIHHDSGLHLFGVNTRLMGYRLQCKAGMDYRVEFRFTVNLGIGKYFVNVSAHSGLTHLEKCYFWKERVVCFDVEDFCGIQFDGIVRLMPVCHIGNGLQIIDVLTDEVVGFSSLGFDTPVLEEIKGSIRALADVPRICPGEQFSMLVEINNCGKEDWICEGIRPVNIAYHWLNMNGDVLIFDGVRTPLPSRVLRSGDTLRAAALIEAPKECGRFVLELTLVQEQVCWFEERGFEPARCEVDVR